MKYLYWLGAVAVIGVGIYFSMNISVQPQAVSKIQFSQFSSPEEFGKVVFEKLRLEVREAPLVLLGVTPNMIEDMEFWRGFLESNQEKGYKYDVIVVEPLLPYVELFDSNMRIDIKDEMRRFVEGVKKARAEGLRVAVIVPNIYSSQLIAKNPVDRLKMEFQLDVTSFSVTKFPLTSQQEQTFEPRCIMDVDGNKEPDPAGTGSFGCMVLTIARKTYRKKFEENKYSGLVEQVGPKDYMILLNRNAGAR